MKKLVAVLTMAALFLMIIDLEVQAEAPLSRGQALNLLQETFSAQVSLSEKPRTMEEIVSILDPLVTSDFRQSFLEANLVYVDGKYQTFGSDFAPYYIPFFTYNKETNFALADNHKGYVYEKFTNHPDGPVRYREGYRGVELQVTDEGWKVHKILSPEEMAPVIEKLKNTGPDTPKWNKEGLNLSFQTFAVIPSVYFVPLYFSSIVFSHLSAANW